MSDLAKLLLIRANEMEEWWDPPLTAEDIKQELREAAAEIERLEAYIKRLESAEDILEEREACAKIAEGWGRRDRLTDAVAAAIRARGGAYLTEVASDDNVVDLTTLGNFARNSLEQAIIENGQDALKANGKGGL
jgi:hypothetical protein